jgi:xylulose-5-phosphate/fructose-6-phosphate phosphoketolase
MHVHGFREKGTTTTPFDMVVLNELDRFHLAIAAIGRVPALIRKGARAKQSFQARLIDHHRYIREHGEDMPDIQSWHWQGKETID